MTVSVSPVGWRSRAACSAWAEPMWTEPSQHVNPRRRHAQSAEWRRTAIRVCGGCPVRAECLAEGLDADRPGHVKGNYPIYGGFTAGERALWARMVSPAVTSRTAGDDAAEPSPLP